MHIYVTNSKTCVHLNAIMYCEIHFHFCKIEFQLCEIVFPFCEIEFHM